MAGNNTLNKAKVAKQDEFYTRRVDIEAELSHYEKFFEGKTVYCNCDDPESSEFWQFFHRNFRPWKLKKLIATHYEPDDKNYAYMLELSEDTNGDGVIDWNDEPVKTQIPCNGDFKSAYCIDLLKEADIVVTNPPFSLIRDYIAQLVEYGKEFVIMAPLNAVKYKEVFPLIKNNEIWLGYKPTGQDTLFHVPKDYAEWLVANKKEGSGYKVIDGEVMGRANVVWLTNLDIEKRHQNIDLRGNYYDPEKYPRYDNLDAIDVKKVADIPEDFEGLMGVPISFLDSFNPEQFELIGCSDVADSIPGIDILGQDWIDAYRAEGGTGHYTANMKSLGLSVTKHKIVFSRMMIKNKNPKERRTPNAD